MRPKLFLISSPRFKLDEFKRFLRTENLAWKRTPKATSAEELVEVSGRICYLSFGRAQSPRSNREYIQNLIANEHESVLEHASWTFLLTGISRSFTHQLVRHRAGFSFSQLSQQYHDESNAKSIEPAFLRNNPEALKIWRSAIEQSKKVYAALIQPHPRFRAGNLKSEKEHQRAIRSVARSVLPNATETKIMISANARSLRHFLRVRGAIEGDLEMRQVSALFLETMKTEAPTLFEDFETKNHSDGFPIVFRRKRE